MMAVLSAVQTIRELSSVRGRQCRGSQSAATGAKPLPMTKYKTSIKALI